MRAVCLFLLLTMGLMLGGCGNLEWFPDPPEVASFSFSPATVDGVALNSVQTSNAVTLRMTAQSAAVTVTGGEYSINGGPFVTAAGTALDGDRVAVRHTAGDTAGETVTTTLTVGGKTASFASTTVGDVAAFSFTPGVVFGVTPGSTQTSSAATLTVTGTVPISVTGGSYSIDGGAFTTLAGSIPTGTHELRLQHTAADDVNATAVVTTVTVAGRTASFTSSTRHILPATVDATGPANDFATGEFTLQIVPGNYEIAVIEGVGLYSLNGAAGDYDFATQTVAFTNGQTIHFQDITGATSGGVERTVFTIDGVPIVFNARTQ